MAFHMVYLIQKKYNKPRAPESHKEHGFAVYHDTDETAAIRLFNKLGDWIESEGIKGLDVVIQHD